MPDDQAAQALMFSPIHAYGSPSMRETPDPLMANFSEGPPEQAGETLTTVQTNEEKVEVNSVL